MQNAETFWDGAAEGYAKSPIRDVKSYEYTLGRTRSYLGANDHVLELGCGTGSTALLLAPHVGQVTASDISSRMVEIGRDKAQAECAVNVDFVAADLFSDALGPGPYDAVLALNLLHLVKDQGAAIERISKLLKPGGVFISKTVCTPGIRAPFWMHLMRIALPVMQWLGKAPFVAFAKPKGLEAMIESRGFRILEAGDFPPPSRYIMARKTSGV